MLGELSFMIAEMRTLNLMSSVILSSSYLWCFFCKLSTVSTQRDMNKNEVYILDWLDTKKVIFCTKIAITPNYLCTNKQVYH